MELSNIAYETEYMKYRTEHYYLFDDTYKDDIEKKQLLDGVHTLEIIEYTDIKNNNSATKCNIYDLSSNLVAEIKCIGSRIFWFSEVEHANGRRYLIYSIDLYGYSIMDLSNYETYDYMPSACLTGGETFIWTKAMYCSENNLLVVDGCYWACPYSFEIYDFFNPNIVPLCLIVDSCILDNDINTARHVTPLQWNGKGDLVIECYKDDNMIQMTLDVSIYK